MTGRLQIPGWRHHGVGAALAVGYMLFLAATSDPVGIPRDESFYFDAADNAGTWVVRLFQSGPESFSRAEIDRYFQYNHEHPVLMKMLFGVSHELFTERLGWIRDHALGYRLPTMALAGGTLWLVFLLGFMVSGSLAGIIGALALGLMPRFFFHAHLACFDAPVTFAWTLIVYAYLRAARSRRWALASGLALGVGFATKLNVFFVPFTLLGVAALDAWQFKRRTGAWRAPGDERGPLTYHAWTAGSMLVLGAAVFFAHWPWLWFDTVKRVGFYLSFHARHVHYPVDWLGHLYYGPPFPVSFPVVATLATVPVPILVLGAIGLAVAARGALAWWRSPGGSDSRAVEVALLANLAVPMAVIALPFTPIFGGTKHWMPAMPFLGVLCGVGATRLAEGLFGRPEGTELEQARTAYRVSLLGGALGAVLLLPALWDTLRYGSQGPAYYNPLVGGPPGAAELRLHRNFWGHSARAVLPFVNANVEKRGQVWWHNTTRGSFEDYKRDGRLRDDVLYTGDWTAPWSNWAVYEEQMNKLPEEVDVWRAYGTDWPVGGYFLDGVQLVSVYHRPEPPKPPPVPPGGR